MPIREGIYYFDYGQDESQPSQPVLILIHGAGGNYLNWPSAMRRMQGGMRVLALDLPGHGKSEGLGEQYISGYVKAIMNWVRALELPKAIFVGHSMGGAIVQQLALEHPEHVQAIGLIGTGTRLPVNNDLLEKVSRTETFPSAVELIAKWSYKKNVDAKMVELSRKTMLETRPTVLHGDFVACNEFNSSERLSEISVPALVVCGAEDKMTPPHMSETLSDSLPAAQLHIVPEAGHMVALEQPEHMAKLVSGFIKGLI